MDLSAFHEQYSWAVTLILAVVILFVTWLAQRIVARMIYRVGKSDSVNLPSSSIFASIARVAIWVAGIAVMLKACFNYDVTAFIAALGIGGIALSLGLQDTLSNLIGGLQVSMGRILKEGDYIEVLSQTGRVTDIDWRHTTIVDAGGNEHLIPNSLINKNSLINIGDSDDVRVPFLLPLGSDVEDFARRAELAVRAEMEGMTGPNGVRVRFVGEEADGVKGNMVVDLKRSAMGAETAADRIFRAMYPIMSAFKAKERADNGAEAAPVAACRE